MSDICEQCGATPVREVLDGDALCQECCDAWARAEGNSIFDEIFERHQRAAIISAEKRR